MHWTNANPIDIAGLSILDIKCFELPWSRGTWDNYFPEMTTRILRHNYKDIAFWCGRPEEGDNYRLLKMGVHPTYRKRGYAREALNDCIAMAKATESKRLVTEIPEMFLQPTWADTFLGRYLFNQGWTTAKKNATVNRPHRIYGVEFCHSYRFERALKAVELDSSLVM